MYSLPKNISVSNYKHLQRLLSYSKVHCSNSAASVLFVNKDCLPSLPVPKLSNTLNKYLKSVEPFLNEAELAQTKRIVKKFELDEAPILQSALEKRAANCENWLKEWWDNVAYLEYRDPVTVFSSPGLVFPLQNFLDTEDWLKYTAKLILAAVDYKLLIDRDAIPLEKMGKSPLDMNQYKKIYGTCRIPAKGRDRLEFNQKSQHIIVARNNNFIKLEVLNNENQVPSLKQLIEQLKIILKISEKNVAPVGILSSDNRNNWSESYQILTQSSLNKDVLTDIQKSLFLLCLDKTVSNSTDKDDDRVRTAGKQLIHGGGSKANSGNRWFDKTVQFIVSEDGLVGLTYEHSPTEGQPIAVLVDHVVNYINGISWNNLPDIKIENNPVLLNIVSNGLKQAITEASINVDKLADNLELNIFKFDKFGKDFVKSQKLSPDSFIQIAMQYAFFRLHEVPGAHYESAATRKYIHGRTETIRSCSIESIAFAKTMLHPSSNDVDKVNALKNAINSHRSYTVEAVNGFGVDRHLLGLKLIAKELNKELPDIYKDVAFTRSSHMRLSTSQVAMKCDGVMTYGPLVGDGYACCYNPRDGDINFAVSSFKDNPVTSADKFRAALENSLTEMHDLLARTQKAKL